MLRGLSSLVRTASIETTDPAAARDLIAALGEGPFAHIFVFVSANSDFPAFMQAATAAAGNTITGCTTSGEITPDGYCDNGAVALALPSAMFAVECVPIQNMGDIDAYDIANTLLTARHQLWAQNPDWPSEFAFSISDGMSLHTEAMLRRMTPGLAGLPFFGGSAGDGMEFDAPLVAMADQIWREGAVIAVVRCKCPIKVFSLDHFVPTKQRMIVTRAEPDRRIVYEINAEPAATEYARMVGLDEADLCANTFAANPMVVRFGETHYVRSIMRLGPNSTLEMASAIDEGVVMSLAEPSNIADHLQDGLEALCTATTRPDTVLAFDCLWRRISIEESQLTGRVSRILQDHNVVGFNTYGEQVNRMHVNQTLTGVAIYPIGAHIEDE